MPSSTLPTPHAIVRSSMPLPGQPETDLTSSLDHARRDLLDLGLRNTLLNFRPLPPARKAPRPPSPPGKTDGPPPAYSLPPPQPKDNPGAAAARHTDLR